MNLSHNTILITGGGSGIGFEFVKQLSSLNNQIIITGRDQKKLDAVTKQFPKVRAIQSDVSDPKAITALYSQISNEYPDFNMLINNAGIIRTMNFHDKDCDLVDLTREIDTNLSGPIRMVKQFLPLLKTKKTAAIVNVSSGLAFVPLPITPIYCATKAALHSFSLSLRVQLKNTNVKVFELAPPLTETELLKDFMSPDMKGVNIMKVDTMVAFALQGIKAGHEEIRPGQSNQLKFMSRLAPQFILDQMSKPVERMLSQTKH